MPPSGESALLQVKVTELNIESLLYERLSAATHHSSASPSAPRGNGQQWRPCVVDVAHKHCDVYHPAFWQTIHTLSVTETNGLGSKSTSDRFKLHELRKITQNTNIHVDYLIFYVDILIYRHLYLCDCSRLM